ncbi:MAG: CubicO group peptidase (beta-lactamase class C family) [Candidatus Aldehydirespiratoraceae bacterium]|jgi:CubicO group peptidase (beta-lactamase class C family)
MTDVRGQVDEGFGPVADAFAANFAEHEDVGAGFSLYADGKLVVDLTGGTFDAAGTRPYDDAALQLVFSTTKGAAAICAAILHERGELDYEAPVSQYWPEFAANGKGDLSVAWLMSHRCGLISVDNVPSFADVLAIDPIVEALAAQAPLWELDGSHGYHALTYGWLVGELVRRISGQRIGAFFQENVAQPLGLEFWIGLPEEQESRVSPLLAMSAPTDPAAAELMLAFIGPGTLGGRALSLDGAFDIESDDNPFNTRAVHASEIPAANGITNATSLARMYAATVGEVDGVRLMNDATREMACAPVTGGNDKCLVFETKFGMGFMTYDGVLPLAGPRSYGHAGAGGSLGYADPDLGIGFGYVMNQMSGSLVGDPRTLGLTEAVKTSLS